MTTLHRYAPLSLHWTLARATWLVLAAAPLAYAEAPFTGETCGDSSCPVGYTCQTAPGACPAIFCDGPGCGTVCDPQPVQYCAEAACNSNADCGEGMLCAEHAKTICEDVATPTCAPGERCEGAPDARDCTTVTTFSCTPRWQLPCSADTDCGAGFTCEDQETCSAPAYPADPGDREAASADPDRADVTCEPSGVFACVAAQVECASNADCPANWTCSAVNDLSCTDAAGGNDCQLAARASYCQPPYSNLGTRGVLLAANAETDSSGDDDLALPPMAPAEASASSGAGCALQNVQSSSRSGFGVAFFALGAVLLRARRRRVA